MVAIKLSGMIILGIGHCDDRTHFGTVPNTPSQSVNEKQSSQLLTFPRDVPG